MQLKWTAFIDIYHLGMETMVFDTIYSVSSSCNEWVICSDPGGRLAQGFETIEEAMIAAHRIIEKELEKGYVGKADIVNRFKAKFSYIPEDMFGCKKALALFTNENGDEYIDSALISATIPKGSLVREVDPEHHDDLPASFDICRKCRSDRAVIVDILEPMHVRPGDIYSLPSCKTQRKKIPIISVHIVTLAFRKYFIAQEGGGYAFMPRGMQYRNECAVMRKLIERFMSIILNPNTDARFLVKWLNKITKSGVPVSLELAIVARVLEPYMDTVARYQEDPYMCCKVLLARILRDIGIMDIALRQSYKIGDKIQIDDFDLSNNACGAGFHFFKTAIEAWNYSFN